jgi:uncharacterized SAM-binding protein YcdF (DUF218 family)
MEKEKLNQNNNPKLIRRILFILLALFVGTFLVIEGFILYYAQKEPKREPDILIILGARLYGTVPSPALKNRLDRGLEYLTAHPEALVIVSGGLGRGEEMTEASAMKSYLMEKGIDEKRILLEDRSYNTYENIKFSLETLKEKHPDLPAEHLLFGVVTNDFHVFRGIQTAKDFGLDTIGLPSKTPPSILLKSYLREYLSVLKYLILDRPKIFQ